MLTRLSIANFKSLAAGQDIELLPITVFAGPNNAGKSSVLQAVLLLAQTLASKAYSQPVVLNGPLAKLGQYREILNREALEAVRIACEIDTLYPPVPPSVTSGGGLPESRVRTLPDARLLCEVAFGVDPDNPESQAVRLTESKLTTAPRTAYDEIDSPLSASIRIRRAAGTVEERWKALNLDDEPGNAVKPALQYDVELNTQALDPLSEYATLHSIVGVELRHFMPTRLLMCFDQTDEMARFIAEAVCEASTRSQLSRLTPIPLRPRIPPPQAMPIPPEVLEFLLTQPGISAILKDPPAQSMSSSLTLLDWLELVSRLRPKDRVRIREQLHGLQQQVYELQKASKPPKPELQFIRLPAEVAEMVDRVEVSLGTLVRYLGPLREEPRPVYQLGSTLGPFDVGTRGEFTAAVLDLNRDVPVIYIDPNSFLDYSGDLIPLNDTLLVAVTAWLRYLGVAESVRTADWGTLGHSMQVATQSLRSHQNLTSVGVGVSQVLPILVMCLLADQGSTIVIEQPELHLHPAVQSRLADFFIATAFAGRQCIVETHSEHIIHRLRLRVAQAEGDAVHDATRLYFVDQEAGQTRVSPVELSRFGAIFEWPEGFFDQTHRAAEEILSAAMHKRQAPDRSSP